MPGPVSQARGRSVSGAMAMPRRASAKSQRVRVASGAARTSQVRSFFGITLAARPAPGWPELLRPENSLLCGSPHRLGAAAQRLEGGCLKPIRGQDRRRLEPSFPRLTLRLGYENFDLAARRPPGFASRFCRVPQIRGEGWRWPPDSQPGPGTPPPPRSAVAGSALPSGAGQGPPQPRGGGVWGGEAHPGRRGSAAPPGGRSRGCPSPSLPRPGPTSAGQAGTARLPRSQGSRYRRPEPAAAAVYLTPSSSPPAAGWGTPWAQRVSFFSPHQSSGSRLWGEEGRGGSGERHLRRHRFPSGRRGRRGVRGKRAGRAEGGGHGRAEGSGRAGSLLRVPPGSGPEVGAEPGREVGAGDPVASVEGGRKARNGPGREGRGWEALGVRRRAPRSRSAERVLWVRCKTAVIATLVWMIIQLFKKKKKKRLFVFHRYVSKLFTLFKSKGVRLHRRKEQNIKIHT